MPLVRPSLKSAFLLAFLSALAASYFLNTPIPFFLTRLQQFGLAGVILWSAGGWGAQILHLGRHPRESGDPASRKATGFPPTTPGMTDLEILLFSVVLGLIALSEGMIVLGVLHLWISAGAWALLVGGIAWSGPFLKNLKRLFSRSDEQESRPSGFLWPAVVFAGGLLSLPFALAPITYYDSLVYHFALPAAYVQAGHWIALPHLIYSAFPQTLEMLWTLALLIGDDIVANLIAWSMSLALLAAVIAFAKRFLDNSVGWVAAGLLALMPAFLLLSTGGYVDVGLALFSFLALYAAGLWVAQPTPSFLVCSGLFAGAAIGTKYTGALPALLVAAVLARRAVASRKDLFRTAAIFCGSVLITAGPWGIKNILYVGNPVFPFLRQWGLQALNPWLNSAAAGYFAGITEYASRSLFELPSLLWEAAVNGLGFGRGIDILGDFGWIPLLGFLPVLWLCRKWPGTIRLLLIFSGAFFVPWAFSHPVFRFLLPIAPLLALLAAYAWVHGVRPQAAVFRWLFRGFLVSFLLSGLFLFFYVADLLSPFRVAAGLESRDAYLTRRLDYYGAARFVNTTIPPDSVVYVFGDQRGYYYERKLWISPVFSKNLLMEWANASATPAELRQKLKQAGLTHLVFNHREHERLKSYPFYRFTDQGQSNWDRLQKQLAPLYRDPACDVYAL